MRTFRFLAKIALAGLGIVVARVVAKQLRAPRRAGAAEHALDDLAADLETAADLDAIPTDDDQIAVEMHDLGAMYGEETTPLLGRRHADDDQAMELGENWLEALSTNAVENSGDADYILEIIEDDGPALRGSESRDIPVADYGAGGPRGL